MIKVSDFIFQHLVGKHNIEHCFLVTGGGAMHLNDSLGHHPKLKCIYNHHEQACSIAAEGNVIMSHNADVLRHPQSQFAAVEHGAVGQHVMTADNGSTAIL